MYRTKKLFSLCILLFFVWVVLIRLGEKKASTPELTLATIIYFVCCLPFLIYFGRSEKNIPYLPLLGIFYFVYFGFSIFNNYSLFSATYLTPEIITKCLSLALFGFISLMVAFYTFLGKMVASIVIPLKIPWDLNKAYRLGIFTGVLGIIMQYLGLKGQAPIIIAGVATFLANLSLLGIAILFMLHLQNKLKLGGKIFLWIGIFIPKIFFDLVTGFIYPVIIDFMVLFFLYFYYYKSIPWLRISIALAIFFLIASAKAEYRELTWYGKFGSASPLQKGVLYGKLIYKRLSGEKKEYRPTYEALSSRTDYLITFAKVVELTPAYIPFWGGHTYTTLWTNLMPRFIMLDKPEKTLGQEFGHRYRFLDPEDTVTSYNLPILIELYINFGEIGIIVGMFILGLIFRIFYNLFNHPESGEGGFLISTMIFVNLLAIESDFSLIFGNIIQYIILFYIIIKRMKIPLKKLERLG
jgi:hypothetical protein